MPKQLSLFSTLSSLKRSLTTRFHTDLEAPENTASTSKKKTSKRTQGDLAEALACEYLKKHGLVLFEQNYTTRAGEVDLIMQDPKDQQMLIFIEVRYRKNKDFGGAAASVTRHKQQRIIKAALAYQQKTAPQSSMRFDVIAIEGDNSKDNISDKNHNKQKLEWIKSAFDGF